MNSSRTTKGFAIKHDKSIVPSRVLASAAHGVIDAISDNGADADSIFGEVGLQAQHAGDPNFDFNLWQYCELFDRAANRTGNDNFGLEFGKTFSPRHLGPIGYAAISSPTLSTALKRFEHYFPAHQSLTSFHIEQDSDILWLNYRVDDKRIENRRQDAELSMGMFQNIFKEALGQDWSPLEVRFEHARPDDIHMHEHVFGSRVRFGRKTNAFAFRRSDLDARMPGNDPLLYSIIQPILEERTKSLAMPEDFTEYVRNQIKLNMRQSTPTVHDMASILGMTNSRFQRELKRHGLSYSDLLRASREELALHYMAQSDLPLTEIAFSLGYSELSAFSRAFRQWTGMSPQRWRRLNP